jgi:sulfonate transport system permease protein
MPDRPRTRLSGMAVAFAAVGGWEFLITSGLLNYAYLPAPHQILCTTLSSVRSGELANDVAHTLGVALAAAAIASTVGAAVGFVLGLVPAAHSWVMASVDFARTIPAVALVPVAVLTFGPTPAAELLLAVYAASWPAVLSTAAAVTAVHPRCYDVAATLHFDRWTTLRKIVVPAAVPVWLAGIRVSAVVALLVTIVA